MSFYEKHKFLEFFDSEKILNEEAYISLFTANLQDDFIFSLYVSPLDGYAIAKLKFLKIEKQIFEIGIENLAKIECDDKNIYFFKEKTQPLETSFDKKLIEPDFTITVKPFVSFDCDL